MKLPRWLTRINVRMPFRRFSAGVGSMNQAPQSQVGGPPGVGAPKDSSIAYDAAGYPFQVGTQNGTVARGVCKGKSVYSPSQNGFGVVKNTAPCTPGGVPRDLDWQKGRR